MPPSAAHSPSSPSRPTRPSRSPQAVRAVLLGTCAAGLVGLALPGQHSAPSTAHSIRASTAAFSLLVAQPAGSSGTVRTLARSSRTRQELEPKATPLRTTPHRSALLRHPTGWVAPSGAGVVSPFGMRWGRMHKGVDFGARYGAPISAIGDGVVIGAGYQSGESGYGQITIIAHPDGYYSAYAHQSSYLVHEGEHVVTGEVIGYVGATGEVTGPHLHFEIRTAPHGGQVNPRTWLREHGVDV